MQGEWTPKQIDNPDYQGEWVHPEIPNPDYEADESLYHYEDFGSIGFDLWQVQCCNHFIHWSGFTACRVVVSRSHCMDSYSGPCCFCMAKPSAAVLNVYIGGGV